MRAWGTYHIVPTFHADNNKSNTMSKMRKMSKQNARHHAFINYLQRNPNAFTPRICNQIRKF